jgi:hypothetical protein
MSPRPRFDGRGLGPEQLEWLQTEGGAAMAGDDAITLALAFGETEDLAEPGDA